MPPSLSTALTALTALTAGVVGASACTNAGEDRILGITGTGVVTGFAYFDRNGNHTADQFTDTTLTGVRVSFVVRGTRDTAGSVLSDADGTFRVASLPVATYEIVIGTATFGDSVSVVQQDSQTVTVPPADSVFVRFGVSYPALSIAAFRGLAVGKKAFLLGVNLLDFGLFGDSTLHLADTSGQIRVAMRRGAVFAGDSLRVLGVRAERDGEPVMNDAAVFGLGFGAIPSAVDVSTAQAATANGGSLDAALVRVRDAAVSDTATVGDDLHLTVDDGSGVLIVVMDDDVGLDLTGLEPGVTVDVFGLLVPDGQGGWVLKPRQDSDVTVS